MGRKKQKNKNKNKNNKKNITRGDIFLKSHTKTAKKEKNTEELVKSVRR